MWRSTFDNWLAEKAMRAGAEIRDGTSAISASENDGIVTVTLNCERTYTEQTRYVIDCEGVVCAFKRTIIPAAPDNILTFQTFNNGEIDLDPHYFYAYLQPELSQYDAWFNVKDDQLVLGVAVKDFEKSEFYYNNFISYMSSRHGLKINKTHKSEKWLMPRIRPRFEIEYGTRRVLFAGEAAGFLNPMGEGISAGMESGYHAAVAVAEHFGNSERILEDYKNNTLILKTYMERQWNFVAGIADTFSEFRF